MKLQPADIEAIHNKLFMNQIMDDPLCIWKTTNILLLAYVY